MVTGNFLKLQNSLCGNSTTGFKQGMKNFQKDQITGQLYTKLQKNPENLGKLKKFMKMVIKLYSKLYSLY